MFEQAESSSSSVLNQDSTLAQLADVLVQGASLFEELRLEEAFVSSFFSKKKNTQRWDTLPFIAVWVSCCLAYIGGVTADEVTDEVIDSVTDLSGSPNFAPLDKQQTIAQWEYFGRVVPSLLTELGVPFSEVKAKQLELFRGDTLKPIQHPFQPPKSS